ncbi:type II toxin-antitoxin system VapC family toxin [Labedaea rhizosphaerae]|uniref:Putative nucleic acid-binding protein n=1 Tax=Labedaea rhizosphaerae TaxID=598644 RepID=A0A4V3CXE8_LABRH|nr:type II toxin-antitoxin system VapC family toxin [Labedaea rhizosphaerae]TDP89988.1 putative nucleic acid-binding protein [Labedaea rhizosphaerae]
MTRYVIDPGVAIKLAADQLAVGGEHKLVAPTLLRSQVLSILYGQVRAGELTKKAADRYLDHMRGLKIRLLGDRVLQANAWKVADRLGWTDTFTAEYIALTQLQADAFVTLDAKLARVARELVTVASIDDLRHTT